MTPNAAYRQLMSAFADINNVMNAAAHAQLIPESQAETTLDIAADLIAVLENIIKDLPNNGTEAT